MPATLLSEGITVVAYNAITSPANTFQFAVPGGSPIGRQVEILASSAGAPTFSYTVEMSTDGGTTWVAYTGFTAVTALGLTKITNLLSRLLRINVTALSVANLTLRVTCG